MLELRPCCEHCGRDLPPEATDARICTFECTFCAACTDDLLGGVCPNCGGELLPRPIRPAGLLAGAPPSSDRVQSPADLEAHTDSRAVRSPGPDHPGVVLRRYVECWRDGDLDGLVACYAEDFTLHYNGRSSFAGVHRGKAAALGAMAEVSTRAQRELLSVDEVMVSDGGGALVVTERLSRDDESHDLRRVLRYRVAEGLLAECWLHDEDQDLVDHLWR